MITIEDFLKVDIRVGTIVGVMEFPQAKKPAYKLVIDFGPEIGQKKSSAQVTDHYRQSDLLGKQVIAVVNFPPRQVANFMSDVLTLGFFDKDKKVVMAVPDQKIPNGQRLC